MVFMLLLLLYQTRDAEQARLSHAESLHFFIVDRAQHFVMNSLPVS